MTVASSRSESFSRLSSGLVEILVPRQMRFLQDRLWTMNEREVTAVNACSK